jgi:hypothetical protein
MKKITSMTMLLSFVVLIFNSFVLYIAPEGRVAYWSDWRFWGLTKSQWGDQHVTVGFLFLVAGLLHLFYNWKLVVAYLKDKARKIKIFTLSFNVALVLTVIFVFGTYYSYPPMTAILHVSDSIKEAGAKKYGEPPYGHAELSSLRMFAKKENLDLEKAISLLRAAGFTAVDGKETIKDIAGLKNLTPQQVYEIIKTAKRQPKKSNGIKGVNAFPDAPAPGFGRMTLVAFCKKYHLDPDKIVSTLARQGIKAEGGHTMKENASANGKEPMELFEILQKVATTPKKIDPK